MKKEIPLEKEFQKKVLKYLKGIDSLWCFKSNELSMSGIPDILGCYKGKFIALELKRSDKHHATPLQLYTIAQINDAQGYARVVNPENWEKIKQELKELVK